jgi:hypothetical protein
MWYVVIGAVPDGIISSIDSLSDANSDGQVSMTTEVSFFD